ncbi:MAG: bifunctional glycosyltransferase family 2/GtrA family protein [Eubacteriales bacterium]|nr:bifunctional glycosyltransferase family 2/GtrA family protein [Eubacteriales bacterium]
MINESARDTAILIPSYKPDGKLAPYVEALAQAGFAKIVIVDDGSGADFRPVFDALPHTEQVRVLHYEPNGGKGHALKTGFRFLQEECPECRFIVTADSDGQHTVADTLRMADALHEDGAGLLLGSRDFSGDDVPKRSRMGNRITTAVFHGLYGQRVEDTQTGLRGFSRELLPRFSQTKGERYEYEMNQLIECAQHKIPIRALTIQTVYENNNEGSHFHPVRDSLRIYRCILSGFFRFISASMICFLADYGLYLLLNNLLKSWAPGLDHEFRFFFIKFVARIGIATVAARIVSGVLNFFINRSFVFQSSARMGRTFVRYLGVFFLIMFLSAGLTSSMHIWLGWSDNLAKMPVDIALFFLSYYLQRRWVFIKAAPELNGKKESAE